MKQIRNISNDSYHEKEMLYEKRKIAKQPAGMQVVGWKVGISDSAR